MGPHKEFYLHKDQDKEEYVCVYVCVCVYCLYFYCMFRAPNGSLFATSVAYNIAYNSAEMPLNTNQPTDRSPGRRVWWEIKSVCSDLRSDDQRPPSARACARARLCSLAVNGSCRYQINGLAIDIESKWS